MVRKMISIVLLPILVSCSGDVAAPPTGPPPAPPPDPPPAPPTLVTVRTTTSGTALDMDGYDVVSSLWGSIRLGPNDEVTLTVESPWGGQIYAELQGLAETCWIEGSNPRRQSVSPGDSAALEFYVACAEPWQLPHPLLLNTANGAYRLDGAGAAMVPVVPGWSAVPSADGSMVAFWGQSGTISSPPLSFTSFDVFTASADGTGIQPVTSRGLGSLVNLFRPDLVWSPDGLRLAFYRSTPFPVFDVIDLAARPLTFGPIEGVGSVMFGGFSPDGRYLVYTRDEQIWRWDFVREIGTALGPGSEAVLSRDGKTIAFVLDGDIHTMTRGGTDRRNLTGSPDPTSCPVWSNSGEMLAFESGVGREREIRIVRASGGASWSISSGWVQLCQWSTPTRRLWSLDDAMILVNKHWEFDGDVYAVAVDGSEARNITRSGEGTMSAAWMR